MQVRGSRRSTAASKKTFKALKSAFKALKSAFKATKKTFKAFQHPRAHSANKVSISFIPARKPEFPRHCLKKRKTSLKKKQSFKEREIS
ncbi:MAG: hypothetical protein J6Q12_07055 [Bacteroidales bacterium]|nr:hypothetical protein [Bacteroidales bacterium]